MTDPKDPKLPNPPLPQPVNPPQPSPVFPPVDPDDLTELEEGISEEFDEEM